MEQTLKSQFKITRRGLLKAGTRAGIAAAASSLVGLRYAEAVEPEGTEIKHVTLDLPRLDTAFDSYRIVQISDLHFDGIPGDKTFGDGWMTGPRLKKAIERINALQPDLVAITGDIVSRFAKPFADSLIDALRTLRPRDATCAILGNHDYWEEPEEVRRILQQSGTIELNNTVHTLRRGNAMLHIAGLDDIWVGKPNLAAVIAALPAQGAAILLAHEPDYADDSVKTGRFDLQLSGHSHGGQVRLPGCAPLRLPPLGQKYHTGLYQVEADSGEKMIQYTNRGLGMVRPYVRFCCTPEITALTLRSANQTLI